MRRKGASNAIAIGLLVVGILVGASGYYLATTYQNKVVTQTTTPNCCVNGDCACTGSISHTTQTETVTQTVTAFTSSSTCTLGPYCYDGTTTETG